MPRRAPGPHLRARLSAFDHPCGADLASLLARHPFNSALELLVPLSTIDASAALQPRGAPFFYAATLSLPQLVDPAFVDAYLRRSGDDEQQDSSVCALSACTPLDRADAAALTPDGTLHLSLTREAYQTLGVPGAAAAAPRGGRVGKAQRYGAALALLGANCAPGRRHYERAAQCLREQCGPLRFLLSRTLGGCSAEFAFPPAAHAVRHALRPATRRLSGLTLPPVEEAFGGEACAAASAAADVALLGALHEWLGAVAAGAAGSANAGRDAADSVAVGGACYEWPLPPPWGGQRGGWAEAHRWQGLLAACHVAHAVAAARAHVAARRAPWAAVSVWGFTDSPVAWLPRQQQQQQLDHHPAPEHARRGPPPPPPRHAGANDYTLLLLPQDRWLLLTAETQEA